MTQQGFTWTLNPFPLVFHLQNDIPFIYHTMSPLLLGSYCFHGQTIANVRFCFVCLFFTIVNEFMSTIEKHYLQHVVFPSGHPSKY